MKIDALLRDTLASVHAPAPARTWPDAFIDFWGAVYLANPALRARGVRFEVFLEAPAEILAAVTRPAAGTPPTLLPPQRVLMRQLIELERLARLDVRCAAHPPHADVIRDWIEVRDGRAIEKLRHKRWARAAGGARFFPRLLGKARP